MFPVKDGAVIGWPLFMSAVVIAGMIAGTLTGEWSRAGAGPLRIMCGGVICWPSPASKLLRDFSLRNHCRTVRELILMPRIRQTVG